jgi:serine phosphatase RsbU (regulator of sigma subunit)
MPAMDYAAVFAASPSPYLVLDPELVIVEVNQAYLEVTGRTRDDLLGQRIFDAFPEDPEDPEAEGMRTLHASLQRVLDSGEPDALAFMKYDIPVTGKPGTFEERWWSPVNKPVFDADGKIAWIIHRSEDVTAYIRTRSDEDGTPPDSLTDREALEAELYARARELQQVNEELRDAHTRESQVAFTLQEAMLQSPDLSQHAEVAVRYLPATGSLSVCGDWFDVVNLPDGTFAVAIGDVVGHGLEAAAVMGMLRSALSAAMRAVGRPAQALEVLGLYARSVEGAMNTTAIKVLVDPRSKVLVYSSAGHPPPVLVSRNGECELLDQATDPPLGARPLPGVPRPQAVQSYRTGDALVLYTDGLIERRHENIDDGLTRLIDTLSEASTLAPEEMADRVLERMRVSDEAQDDVTLVIVRM